MVSGLTITRNFAQSVQNLRKSSGLAVEDRIRLRWEGGDRVGTCMSRWGERLAEETLALELGQGAAGRGSSETYEIAGEEILLELEKAE